MPLIIVMIVIIIIILGVEDDIVSCCPRTDPHGQQFKCHPHLSRSENRVSLIPAYDDTTTCETKSIFASIDIKYVIIILFKISFAKSQM